MKLKVIPLGLIQANCSIVGTQNNNAFVVDPGGEYKKILSFLEAQNLTLKKILLTHAHHDHIAAVWDLIKATDCEVYIHEGDVDMLEDRQKSLCSSLPYFEVFPIEKLHKLHDMDKIQLDELEVTLVHTPGHSKGSSVYLLNDIMFSGDTLFAGDCGRCDLYGGDYPTIKESLKRLADLEGDYTVITGHGSLTQLSRERVQNPYMGNMDNDNYF